MTVVTTPPSSSLTIVKHPLIAHKLSILRSVGTTCVDFRRLVHDLSLLLAYEATLNLPLQPLTVDTPLETLKGSTLKAPYPVIVPILRAGLGMMDAFIQLIPKATVGFIGLARDETTHLPHSYYENLPETLIDTPVYLCDPMLATGGSAIEAIKELKKLNANTIRFICLVASPEGVKTVQQHFPEIEIITASLDRELNDDAYILPGLGDAGDRLFGT